MKSETVRINDIDLFYEMEGSGQPLLLLHGGTGCHQDWIHVGAEAFVHEYTLGKPDARGQGRTNNPQSTITHRQYSCPYGNDATGSNQTHDCRQCHDVFPRTGKRRNASGADPQGPTCGRLGGHAQVS